MKEKKEKKKEKKKGRVLSGSRAADSQFFSLMRDGQKQIKALMKSQSMATPPPAAAPSAGASAGPKSMADQIRELHELKTSGVIDSPEFKKGKQSIVEGKGM